MLTLLSFWYNGGMGIMVDNASGGRGTCPVTSYERAGEGYAEIVAECLANPHAYFKSFGPEARAFQKRNRSERLRTMTLVAPADELVRMRPVKMSVDRASAPVDSWEAVFSVTLSRLIPAHPATFAALQADGELAWLGCAPEGTPIVEVLDAGELSPGFGSLTEVVLRVQWLFLMCGIRLNEVIVQVDPFTDEEWQDRRQELRRKRAEQNAFMEGRRAAQKAWSEAHPQEPTAGGIWF